MKKIYLSILFLIISINAAAHVNHYEKYNYLEYELFRNDKIIGYHKYNFIRNGNNLSVNSTVEFKIRKLGVDLYNYFAESEEIYKNDEFHSFSSKTKQNKKDKYVNISLKDEKNLLIDGSSYKGLASKDFIIGTWWNHEIIKTKAQISAISGRIIEQKVNFVGKETIKIGNKKFEALHFNFSSSDDTLSEKKKLNTDIWYEEGTYLWLKASFDKQGYWEYRLKTKK
jgi:hypothetical protein